MGGPVADEIPFPCHDSKPNFTMNPHAPAFCPPASLDMYIDVSFEDDSSTAAKNPCSDPKKNKNKRNQNKKQTPKINQSTQVMVGNVDPTVNFGRLVSMLDTECGRVKLADFSGVLDKTSTIGFVVFCSAEDAERATTITHFENRRIIISRCIGGKGNTGAGGSATSDTILLKNLPFKLNEDDLFDFLNCLEIKPLHRPVLHLDNHGAFKGIAVVQYKNKNDARIAFQLLHHCEYDKRELRVEYKKKQENFKGKKTENAAVDPPVVPHILPTVPISIQKPDNDTNKVTAMRRRSRGSSMELTKNVTRVQQYDSWGSHHSPSRNSFELSNISNTSRLRERGRERSGGSNVSLQNDRYARGPDGSRGFPTDRGRTSMNLLDKDASKA